MKHVQPENQSSQKRGLYGLSLVTFITMYIVNTLGFADTATNSAMGCGKDWPLCNGQIIPSAWNEAVTIEYTHRLSVLFGGFILILLAVLAWKRYRHVFAVKLLIVFSLLGVVLEAGLGALAVLFVNPPAIMATHMGFALWTFVGVGLLMLTIRREERAGNRSPIDASAAMNTEGDARALLKHFRRLVFWSVPYGYAAIYVGAYVASTGYGGAFVGWPIPLEHPSQVGVAFYIDILHRSVALGYLIWMTVLTVTSAKMRRFYPQLHRFSAGALVLVSMQALSGWLLIATKLSPMAFLVHVSIVSFLFATQCYLTLETIRLERTTIVHKNRMQSLERVG